MTADFDFERGRIFRNGICGRCMRTLSGSGKCEKCAEITQSDLDDAAPGADIWIRGFSFMGCQMRKLKNGKWARVSDNDRPIYREAMTSTMVLRIGIVSEGPK